MTQPWQDELHAEVERLRVELETTQNRVYELEHTIQHWETDYEGWKDDAECLRELREAAEAHCKLPIHVCHEQQDEGIRNRLLDSRMKLRAILNKIKS